MKKSAKLYLKEIVCLHGVLVSIMSDQDTRFTSTLWRKLLAAFEMLLKFSIASHPQMDGQSE